MEELREPKLVIIGHFGFDVSHFPGVEARQTVGGAGYYASKAASQVTKDIGVVTRVGTDFDRALLEKLGLDLRGVKTVSGNSPKFTQHYNQEREMVGFSGNFGVAGGMDPKDVPREFLNAARVHITTMPPGKQKAFIDYLKKKGCKAQISVDTNEAYIERFPRQVARVIGAADLVFLNRREHDLLSKVGLTEGKTIVKKKGEQGAEYHQEGRIISVNAPKVKIVLDPTGAGDVLAGAFTAYLVAGQNQRKALKNAVRIASKSVEQYGVEHL